jgi:thiol:disulfide interchange protein DsbD
MPRRGRRAWLALLLGLVAASAQAAIDPDDLLPVDQAFALSASAGADAINVRWEIADGYYLYRHRTSVQADAGFDAEPLLLPPGKPYEDEFFGKVETYRGQLVATLPGQPRGRSATLTVKYQGCADAGICYPPQTRQLQVALPAMGGSGPPARLLAPGNGRSLANPVRGGGTSLLGGDRAEPLPPEQAFGFEAIAADADTLLLRFSPAAGYYLYRDRTTLSLAGAPRGTTLGQPRWPRGSDHRDEYFGKVVVYFDPVEVTVPLRRAPGGPATVRLVAGFQGCQTDGICYPPMERTVEVLLPAPAVTAPSGHADAERTAQGPATSTPSTAPTAAMPTGVPEPSPESAPPASDSPNEAPAAATAEDSGRSPAAVAADDAAPTAAAQAEDSRLAAALSGPDRWWALLSFFGFGLLLAFTPCVLPMIPILSGLIAGASAGHERGLGAARALGLSLVYVLANALVFTVAGVVAGLVGANLQIAFQNPWVLAGFAALFVALALSSFGLYELQLPAALRNRLGALSDRQRGGSLAGVAVMGALSALIVGPCVAPPLAAAVLYIGQTQDPVFGGAALFLLAMGMGVPLLAFGVAAGRGLPTSGPWMVAVQRAFGFVFLGLAAWMLSRFLPGPATLALWGALLLGAAATLAVGVGRARDAVRILGWTAAALLGVGGAAQVVGALAGGHDPLQPLAGLRGDGAERRELPFRPIKSTADLEREIAAARAAGRPLMLDFYADWCVACKEMEKYTFPEPAVHAALADFVLLKADVTANDAADQALMKQLGIIGPPATLFYVDGVERRELRLFGFEDAAGFAARAGRAAGAAP